MSRKKQKNGQNNEKQKSIIEIEMENLLQDPQKCLVGKRSKKIGNEKNAKSKKPKTGATEQVAQMVLCVSGDEQHPPALRLQLNFEKIFASQYKGVLKCKNINHSKNKPKSIEWEELANVEVDILEESQGKRAYSIAFELASDEFRFISSDSLKNDAFSCNPFESACFGSLNLNAPVGLSNASSENDPSAPNRTVFLCLNDPKKIGQQRNKCDSHQKPKKTRNDERPIPLKNSNQDYFTNKLQSDGRGLPIKLDRPSPALPGPLARGPSGEYPSEFGHLFNFWRVLMKLFLAESLADSDFDLSASEKILLAEVVRKKKFTIWGNVEFKADFFNQIKGANLRKKKEDSLKFVFNQTLKHLKTHFARQHLARRRVSPAQLDRIFFSFYYAEVSRQFGLPLEDFSNSGCHRRSALPRSITRVYISKLKLNPQFVAEFREFVSQRFLGWFVYFNLKKIKRLIAKWNAILDREGHLRGVRTISASIHSRGNKFPWTLSEAINAQRNMLDCLD